MPKPVYRIRNWKDIYESSGTRRYARLKWVPVSNNLSSREYAHLIGGEPNGYEHVLAWDLILRVASAVEHRSLRGYLVDCHGVPLDAQDLADMTRVPCRIFEEALTRLLGARLRLLEVAPAEEYSAALREAELLPDGGGDGAPLPDASVAGDVSSVDAAESARGAGAEASAAVCTNLQQSAAGCRPRTGTGTRTGTGNPKTYGGCSLDAGLQAKCAHARARTYSTGPDLTGRDLPTHLAVAASGSGVSAHLVAEALHEGRDEACVLSWLGKAARWRECRSPDAFFRWGVATGGESTLGDHNAAKRILRGAFRPAPAVARACRAERLAKRERDRAVWKYRRLRKLAGRLPLGKRGPVLREISRRESAELEGAA